MLGVYYFIGNVDHHLSDLSSIHLALLGEYPNVVKYSYAEVFKLLIQDLKILETQGISVVTKRGHRHYWKASVAFICGENVSQNGLGGCRRFFSSGKMSRFCMADFSNLANLLSEGDCTPITPEAHAMHV